MNGATITVNWGRGNEVEVSIHLSTRNWERVKAGKPIRIYGNGYYYEGERYQDWWEFGGGIEGKLLVEYGSGGAVGFDGSLHDARIVEHG